MTEKQRLQEELKIVKDIRRTAVSIMELGGIGEDKNNFEDEDLEQMDEEIGRLEKRIAEL